MESKRWLMVGMEGLRDLKAEMNKWCPEEPRAAMNRVFSLCKR